MAITCISQVGRSFRRKRSLKKIKKCFSKIIIITNNNIHSFIRLSYINLYNTILAYRLIVTTYVSNCRYYSVVNLRYFFSIDSSYPCHFGFSFLGVLHNMFINHVAILLSFGLIFNLNWFFIHYLPPFFVLALVQHHLKSNL